MKTPAQSRARELSRMHPTDRRLSKGIYPKVNTASAPTLGGRGGAGRTIKGDDLEGMTAEAVAVRAHTMALAARMAREALKGAGL